MKLKNKYVIGALVQFYELEMLGEYVESCIQMLDDVENPENVTFHFCLNFQEHLEKIDLDKLAQRFNLKWKKNYDKARKIQLIKLEYLKYFYPIEDAGAGLSLDSKVIEPFYNIAAYRRELCDQWCDRVDYVCWGETDSLWPKQTLTLIESLHQMVSEDTPKFVASFAGRKNWDSTWEAVTHPMYRKVQYQDNDNWILNNEASEKAYMTIERMNEINNISLEKVDILEMREPKADGSCLIISSELIRSGVNIPRSLIHCGEDESFLQMAKIIMGNEFVQYNFNNILRVHNRRHPNKRNYILNENNPNGFCDERKGRWWKILEDSSKYNLGTLRLQKKSVKQLEVMNQIKSLND